MTTAALIAFLAVFPPETLAELSANQWTDEGPSLYVEPSLTESYELFPNLRVEVFRHGHTHEMPLSDFAAWYAAHAPTEEP